MTDIRDHIAKLKNNKNELKFIRPLKNNFSEYINQNILGKELGLGDSTHKLMTNICKLNNGENCNQRGCKLCTKYWRTFWMSSKYTKAKKTATRHGIIYKCIKILYEAQKNAVEKTQFIQNFNYHDKDRNFVSASNSLCEFLLP